MTQKICPSISVTLAAQLTPPVALHRDAARKVLDPLFIIPLQKPQQQEPTIELAHRLAEKFFTFARWCRVNKACNRAFTTGKQMTGCAIALLVENVRKKNLEYLRDTFYQGKYIQVFKIYYFYHPNALVEDPILPPSPTCPERSHNLMRFALANVETVNSPSFVIFMLKMNEMGKARLFPPSNPTLYLNLICANFKNCRYLQYVLLHNLLKADPSAQATAQTSSSLIFHLATNVAQKHEKITEKSIRLLQSYGADINQLDADGRNPLHRGIGFTDVNISILLKCGANPNIVTRDGLSPLDICLQLPLHHSGKLNILQLLLKNGAERVGPSYLRYLDPTATRASDARGGFSVLDRLEIAEKEKLRAIFLQEGKKIPWTSTNAAGSNYLLDMHLGTYPDYHNFSPFLAWMYDNNREDLKQMLQQTNRDGVTPYLFMLYIGERGNERDKARPDILRSYMQKLNIPIPAQPALPPPSLRSTLLRIGKIFLYCLSAFLVLLEIKKLFTVVQKPRLS